MGKILDRTIESVRHAADIVDVVSSYVELKKKGRNFFGLCPFHSEKTPSFSVNPERQIFKCFGCGAGGNSINFIMDLERMDFPGAIEALADRYNIEVERDGSAGPSKNVTDQLYSINSIAETWFRDSVRDDKEPEVIKYFKDRGISKSTMQEFGIGFSPTNKGKLLDTVRESNFSPEAMKGCGLFVGTDKGYIDRFRGRIIFPLYSQMGKVIGFAGRAFNENQIAKYINSPETIVYNKSKFLYGLNLTSEYIRKQNSVIIVEGYMDLIQLFRNGIRNVVAASGTAFTSQHATQIKRMAKEVYLCYDGDSAGQEASVRAGYVLLASSITPKIISIPDGMDPDDYILKNGDSAFNELIENSTNFLEFHHALSAAKGEDTAAFLNSAVMELSNIEDQIFRETKLIQLSDISGISKGSILGRSETIVSKKQKRDSFRKKDVELEKSATKLSIEDDLIRICMSKDFEVRKFIFDKFDPSWIISDEHRNIYDKIYIHLHSELMPDISVILNDIASQRTRKLLASLAFDINKIEPTMAMAIEIMNRLKNVHIKKKLDGLREQLKTHESNNIDTMEIINSIQFLQKKRSESIGEA